MKTLHFKCELLTDVILNQRAATEGGQETLDFIPGNNFLGIAAGKLYNTLKPEESLLLFHSGKARFGDAHPEKDKKRTLRIPASMYKGKLLDIKNGLYIHHEVTNPDAPDYKNFQPKQCRTGFYLFENEQMQEIKVKKSYAQKSAYDSNMRRSADEMMFGYEALQEGSYWLFEITLEDDALTFENLIVKALEGEKRIGRSRTAQYGLVEIKYLRSENVDKINVKPLYNVEEKYNYILIYAESRLTIFDEYGLPTFQPTAEQLGIENGEIVWKKSQIRTFQYAPWNSTRQARDADRCGIEKGSVFYVKISSDKEIDVQSFVGSYQNEGFGKVTINPDFLEAEKNQNGSAKYKYVESKEEKEPEKEVTSEDPLFLYLQKQQEKQKSEQDILKKVNDFVGKHESRFKDDKFASQWGTIRSLAMQRTSKQDLGNTLFTNPDAYLVHGIVKDKWDKKSRKEVLLEFFNTLTDNNYRQAMINLSAEMAKISKK